MSAVVWEERKTVWTRRRICSARFIRRGVVTESDADAQTVRYSGEDILSEETIRQVTRSIWNTRAGVGCHLRYRIIGERGSCDFVAVNVATYEECVAFTSLLVQIKIEA